MSIATELNCLWFPLFLFIILNCVAILTSMIEEADSKLSMNSLVPLKHHSISSIIIWWLFHYYFNRVLCLHVILFLSFQFMINMIVETTMKSATITLTTTTIRYIQSQVSSTIQFISSNHMISHTKRQLFSSIPNTISIIKPRVWSTSFKQKRHGLISTSSIIIFII